MADTTITPGSALDREAWSLSMSKEVLARLHFRELIGEGDRAVIQVHRDLQRQRGSTVHYDLLVQLDSMGVQGDNLLEGNEESLVYYPDQLGIDQLGNAVRYAAMSQQRTVHDFRMDARDNLADWNAQILERVMYAHLAGTAGLDTTLAAAFNGFGGNSFLTPDADHLYNRAGNAFSIDDIRKLKERALRIDPLIRPIRTDGADWHYLFLRPEQITSLMNETGGTNGSKWREIHAEAMERGRRNPLFTGAIGVIGGCILMESKYLPRSTSNVNHGLLLGAQAGHLAWGNPYSDLGLTPRRKEFFYFSEETFDYGRKRGAAVTTIFGIKKARFNSADFGVIRVDTTDAQA